MNEDVKIRRCVLQELNAIPEGYTQPEETLKAGVCLLVVPAPKETAISEALLRLEHEHFIVRVDTMLSGVRYAITPAGRAALRS